ncbi:MAG TPA: lipocalin family protein [Cyclobacteriaceae bacterium]|nr:lipocalin family protein [Cyclobacteriaceae bacterium]
MKACFIAILAAFSTIFLQTNAQSLVGTWQLVRHSNCLEEKVGDEDEATNDLLDDIRSRESGTQSVIRFNDDSSGDESIHLLESRKSKKRNNFLYRYSEGKLYFLDKKSRLLVGSYDVDRLSADSLVFSNATRACETRIFVRLE